MATKQDKSTKAIKIGVIGTGLLVGGYALYDYLKDGKVSVPFVADTSPTPSTPAKSTSSNTGVATPWVTGVFPLRVGDKKNYKVQALQRALLSLGGEPARLVNASGGADGYFGAGTTNALKVAGFDGNSVTEATYNSILSGKTSTASGAASTAAMPAGVDADMAAKVVQVRSEVNAFNTDEIAVIGIFAGQSDAWIRKFQAAYDAKYGKGKLRGDLSRDIGGDFKALIATLDRVSITTSGFAGMASNPGHSLNY